MKYIIGFLLTIFLVILVIILLIGGGHKKAVVPATSKPLVDYSNTSVISRVTIDGPINSSHEHEQIRISVGKDQVTYQKFSGYDGQTVDTKQFTNTSASYAVFLKALGHEGYTLGDTTKALQDERGYCPLGNRYIYELIDGSKTIERFWTTSCRKPSTYKGNAPITLDLFKKQVPDYNKIQNTFSY